LGCATLKFNGGARVGQNHRRKEKVAMSDSSDETIYLSRYDGSYCGFLHQCEIYNTGGLHVGTLLFSKRIVAPNGDYLGELRGDRVLTKSHLKGSKGGVSTGRHMRLNPPLLSPGRIAEMSLPNGYEDFPDVDGIGGGSK
jgi:hypothetical protein